MVFRNYKRILIVSVIILLFLPAACYQSFQRLEVKTDGETVNFSHPKITQAFEQKDPCVFGEISVSRQTAAGDYETIWSIQNTESGFQKSAVPMSKPSIVYGENLPQTSIQINPQPLREGKYRVSGIVGIYSENRELLTDLSFNDEFALKNDASGKLVVSTDEK